MQRIVCLHPKPKTINQKAKGEKQKAESKRRKAKGRKQKAESKRQKGKGERQKITTHNFLSLPATLVL